MFIATSRTSVLLATAALVALATACGPIHSVTIGKSDRRPAGVVRSEGSGPPPHAPAHGYRHKQRHGDAEVDLMFDSGLGVYVVVGIPNRYYWDGVYLRLDDGQWYASAKLDGGWAPTRTSNLPPGLQKKTHKAARGKPGKGKKAAPAKGRW